MLHSHLVSTLTSEVVCKHPSYQWDCYVVCEAKCDFSYLGDYKISDTLMPR